MILSFVLKTHKIVVSCELRKFQGQHSKTIPPNLMLNVYYQIARMVELISRSVTKIKIYKYEFLQVQINRFYFGLVAVYGFICIQVIRKISRKLMQVINTNRIHIFALPEAEERENHMNSGLSRCCCIWLIPKWKRTQSG